MFETFYEHLCLLSTKGVNSLLILAGQNTRNHELKASQNEPKTQKTEMANLNLFFFFPFFFEVLKKSNSVLSL